MLARPIAWYLDWLNKHATYSPQPYQQLARVFRAAGHDDKADDVLYAGRERERKSATGLRFWFLSALKYTIGYGYGYRYVFAAGWVAWFTLLGAWFLMAFGQGRQNGMPVGLAFSLDHLLPTVQLRKYHHDVVRLQGCTRYYFYVHKLAGYVLASFLLAGLAGLTQQ